ncbi:ATP-binding cassette domain-containing protein [Aquabacterium sp.]|uniref:ABC transporter ATP-binding protein n=1 Tax=Aquabacterium sp. TaxID=1872578 RepID=UPI003450627D
MSPLDIDHVSLYLGQGSQRFLALQDISLSVAAGEFVCLLGPSGCGKSTLLGALAGHLEATQGALRLAGQAIHGPSPERGLVFQHHTLFPWLSVLDNVAYGLKMRGIAKAERHQQTHDLLEQVGLAGFEGKPCSWPTASWS